MKNLFTLKSLAAMLLTATMLIAALPARAGFLYQISGDTSALNGQGGFLQFSLGGLLDSPLATARISQLQGLSLISGSESIGTVDADLPSSLMLYSAGDYAEHLQAVQFGSQFRFLLELSGAVSGTDSGVSFALAVLDAVFQPQPGHDDFGHWLRIELLPDGTADQQMVSDNLRVEAITSIPLPATLALMCGGLLLLQRQRRAPV